MQFFYQNLLINIDANCARDDLLNARLRLTTQWAARPPRQLGWVTPTSTMASFGPRIKATPAQILLLLFRNKVQPTKSFTFSFTFTFTFTFTLLLYSLNLYGRH